jgi:hypothetical protein
MDLLVFLSEVPVLQAELSPLGCPQSKNMTEGCSMSLAPITSVLPLRTLIAPTELIIFTKQCLLFAT